MGLGAHSKVLKLAEELPAGAWSKLERLPGYAIGTEPREKRPRVKEGIVREKGGRSSGADRVSTAEVRAELSAGDLVRKNLSMQRGEQVLFDEIRYLFYLTNRRELALEAVIGLANGRCDQENVIEQLKNGVNALRLPVDDLESNWAYMVMAALTWNWRAWFALLMPEREWGLELLRMEFRRFSQTIMLLPAQVVRTGCKLVYRILSYHGWLKDFFATIERIGLLRWEVASG